MKSLGIEAFENLHSQELVLHAIKVDTALLRSQPDLSISAAR